MRIATGSDPVLRQRAQEVSLDESTWEEFERDKLAAFLERVKPYT